MNHEMKYCLFVGGTIILVTMALIAVVNVIESFAPHGIADNTVAPRSASNDAPPGNVTTITSVAGVGYRDDVIVYFRVWPSSLEDFASAHGVKVIFSKPDIKMAAFETMPVAESGAGLSAADTRFIGSLSSDPLVESAEHDEFLFLDPAVNYTVQPVIVTPSDLKKNDSDYIPNEVTVGFWKMPASAADFGAKYGGVLINSSFSVNSPLMFATYNTDDVTGFLQNVSTDPYVRYAQVNPTTQIPPNEMNNVRIINNAQLTNHTVD